MLNIKWISNLCINEVNLVCKYIAKKSEYPMKNGGRYRHALLYTIEGSEKYIFKDKTVEAVPDSVVFIPKGEKYSIELDDEKSVVIAFDFELLESTEIVRPFCIKLRKNLNIKTQFQNAETIWKSKKRESELRCKACFYEIVAAIVKDEETYLSGNERQKIAEATDYLHSHYLENGFRVSSLSTLLGMSQKYFETLFFKEYKTTPKEYVLMLKMEFAKELLLGEKVSVSAVSEKLGYSDIYHFSKIFKAKTGYTPTEFKRFMKEKQQIITSRQTDGLHKG